MQLIVDIPDELLAEHQPETTDSNNPENSNALKQALADALSTQDAEAPEITVSNLREAPHSRPLQPWTYYNWEEGDPCPQCGSSEIRLHYVDVVFFTSKNGEFEYDDYRPESGYDPRILWQCRSCSARLKDTVPGTYFE